MKILTSKTKRTNTFIRGRRQQDGIRVFQKLKFGHVLNDIYNLDEIAKFLELPTWDKMEELNDYFVWAGDDAKNKTEREKAVDGTRKNVYSKWKDNLLKIFERLLDVHSMELKPLNDYEFQVVSKSWKKAAEHIIATINGHGMFGYDNPEDLKDAIPVKTIQEAVLDHLHWIKMYPTVYGVESIERMWSDLWGR